MSQASRLRLRGLRAGNLKAVDVDLQLGAWTAVHGPSGAGKSALLFGVLETVSRRRFEVLHDPRALPGGSEDWLRPLADRVEGLTPVVASAGEIPRGRRRARLGDALDLWRLPAEAWRAAGGYACVDCGERWRPPSLDALLAVAAAWPEDARVQVYVDAGGAAAAELLRGGWTRVRLGDALARLEEAPETLPADALLLLDRFRWSATRRDRYREALRAALRRGAGFVVETDGAPQRHAGAGLCPACGATHGSHGREDWFLDDGLEDRWLGERSWADWCAAPLEDWAGLAEDAAPRAARVVALLLRTGLGHLSATRTLGTLSLGEARRLELVSWLSLVRSGQTVLFDEPGMGLHGQERTALAGLLQELVAQGNTVLTADPAREFLEAAHHWLLLGPGGGPGGGEVVGQGPRTELPAEDWEPDVAPAGAGGRLLRFRDLRARHLDVPELALPCDRVVALCGVSGSGKSTLLEEELLPRLRAGEGFEGEPPEGGVSVLLERALHHSPYSTVATLSGTWQEVRAVFADGEEGRIRGLSPSDLVARKGQGGCLDCGGRGAGSDGLPCAGCGGLGLRADLLELRLRNRSLRDWLTTPLEQLEKRLPARGRLRTTVRHLVALGLGARHLGERGRHLSLGERGRIALARALASARPGHPKLFLLDEPCLGLPVPEARRVVALLRSLCADGHGFWVVEHHEVLLRAADHVVELGPGAGRGGGRVVAQGTAADLAAADSATGRWLRGRGEAQLPPDPPPVPELRSAAYPDDVSRAGRLRLEEELRREIAARSPLLADVHGGREAVDTTGVAWAPVAWPVEPARGATLASVLGLDGTWQRILAAHGRDACAACGGDGPWASFEEAWAAHDRAEAVFATPLPEALLARDEHPAWLQAAGFRRFLRGAEGFRWRGQERVALQQGDLVWLDRMSPDDDDPVPRLRDAAHHAGLLGSGRVDVLAPDTLAPRWSWRDGACRDCGRVGAGRERRLGAHRERELRALPLGEALDALEHAAGGAEDCSRLRDLVVGSSLLALPAERSWTSCTEAERRLARLAGWVLHPVDGVALLFDQPLSGLPRALARRLAAALAAPARGAFRWTDPEDWSGAATAGGRTAAAAEVLTVAPQPASTAFDFETWCQPPRAGEDDDLLAALGIEPALVTHFLRTEGARLRGWDAAHLDRRRSPLRCPRCRGRGGEHPHPALTVSCAACGGSGWSAEAGQAEDLGLRWSEVPLTPLDTLAAHFRDAPGIGRVLEIATDFGLGGFLPSTRLRRLPRACRMLAPLAAAEAAQEASSGGPGLRIGLALAGLSSLEAGRAAARIAGIHMAVGGAEWREEHPVVEPA